MKTAVITGAAGGIGEALCSAFHTAGYRIIALDLKQATACDAFVQVDLDRYCQDDGLRAAVNELLTEAIGGHQVSVLVNNAAVQILGPSSELSPATWHTTLNVNLVAPFLLAQVLLDRLQAAAGSVVNIASIHATLTKPGFVCYATSKAALVGLTRSMAVDIGSRVRVNAVCPAAVSTPMLLAGFSERPWLLQDVAALHPVGRIGHPREVADAALYLASERAGFMNGSILGLDGGIGARLHDPL